MNITLYRQTGRSLEGSLTTIKSTLYFSWGCFLVPRFLGACLLLPASSTLLILFRWIFSVSRTVLSCWIALCSFLGLGSE